MPLHHFDRRRQQGMQTLAAHPVRCLPKDNQGVLNLVAVPDMARLPFACLRRSRTPKQAARVLAVIPSHRHEFVQDPRLLRALRLSVALAQDLKQFVSCRHAQFRHSRVAKTIGSGNILEATVPSKVTSTRQCGLRLIVTPHGIPPSCGRSTPPSSSTLPTDMRRHGSTSCRWLGSAQRQCLERHSQEVDFPLDRPIYTMQLL